ncbi:Scr1 family TA system antitoxin-like transcriptional regulator [Nocardiopsis sp. NPDC058631]|uniref:helix-turn-helix domain-containing protein n=1 Tax=Nocardiopsis sp. NPDC058631 TaxID=3346566 RepID=UPI00364B7259
MARGVLKQWVDFGETVRRNRSGLGLSQHELGKLMNVSGGMVGHIERAVRPATRRQVDKLEELFTTDGSLLRMWMDVLKHRNVPDWFRNALSTERRAVAISQYQSILVPGLLQTAAYAEVLVRAWQPRASDAEVTQVVDTRTSRLSELKSKRPTLWFVVDEVVLRRPLGSPAAMREQLDHIAKLIEAGTVRFQVLPTRLTHPGMCPPFRIMSLSVTQTVVFVEHALGDVLRGEPHDVSQMGALFGAMQADALAPAESLRRIHEMRKEYAS